ncbi:hypothetical protein FVB9288_01763 [Flavobacterium sp. CECT 9288]|nr:hypothetical protein FVB9288_01763 [Flavobacterium sp. CECT 9288]
MVKTIIFRIYFLFKKSYSKVALIFFNQENIVFKTCVLPFVSLKLNSVSMFMQNFNPLVNIQFFLF